MADVVCNTHTNTNKIHTNYLSLTHTHTHKYMHTHMETHICTQKPTLSKYILNAHKHPQTPTNTQYYTFCRLHITLIPKKISVYRLTSRSRKLFTFSAVLDTEFNLLVTGIHHHTTLIVIGFVVTGTDWIILQRTS